MAIENPSTAIFALSRVFNRPLPVRHIKTAANKAPNEDTTLTMICFPGLPVTTQANTINLKKRVTDNRQVTQNGYRFSVPDRIRVRAVR